VGIISQGSFLGEATNRLYRALGLDGVIGVKVDDTIQPVVVVGDGMVPGMGLSRGRRFKGFLDAPGLNTVAFISAAEDVIIERVVLTIGGNAAANILSQYMSNVTSGSRLTPFCDRFATPQDSAPVLTTNGGAAVATFALGALIAGRWTIPAGAAGVTNIEVINTPFLLAAGTTILWDTISALGSIRGSFEGRTFG